MKLPGSGGTGAFCSLHTALVTKQTRWGLIPPGGRRPISGQWTAGGKCSPREVLELGKMREGAMCQEVGTIPASTGVRLRWSHISEQQVIQPRRAPFLKCHSFPKGISSTLTWCHILQPVRGSDYFSVSNAVIAASWKVAALMIYGA